MIDIFEARGYREIIEIGMRQGKSRRPRGAVSGLAKSLQCHTTLIAHILSGKSQMGCEQGVRAARHFGLDEAETDYFLTLILWERAGDEATKGYFASKLEELKSARVNLKERWKVDEAFNREQEDMYYASWVPMAIHLATHIADFRSADHLAEALRLDLDTVQDTLRDLQDLGLVVRRQGMLHPTTTSMHLGKGSPALRRCHLHMRQKVVQELTTKRDIEGSNYSSFVTLTERDAKEIRDMVIRQIEEIRETVKASRPETMYLHCVDFFKVC